MSAPTRPIVRYHGGKWILSHWIIANMPAHRVYVEPFGGGGSVLLRKPRSYAEIYNDMDGEIVNVFRVARERGDELVRALELTPFSRDEFAGSYAPSEDPLEQARRTIFRSFAGFGSASACGQTSWFRATSNRSGTTPAHDWANYPACLTAVIDRLRGVVIENRDAAALMCHHDTPDALHYVDPPYVHSTRSEKTRTGPTRKAYKHEMDDAAHAALAMVLRGLTGMVMLSGYPSELYQRLYAGWLRIDRKVHADVAVDRVECLWLNDAAANLMPTRQLFAQVANA